MDAFQMGHALFVVRYESEVNAPGLKVLINLFPGMVGWANAPTT